MLSYNDYFALFMAANMLNSTMVGVPRRSPLLLPAAVASVALVVALAFYLGLQKTAIIDEQKRLETELVALNTEISALESQKVQAAQLAQQWLEALEQEEIRWSTVINRIQGLAPFDQLTSQPKVRFLSYSGGQGGRISLNAQSRATRQEPFADVAELITVFNASSFFSNAYVSSITRGETESGEKILSFLFNLNYQDANSF